MDIWSTLESRISAIDDKPFRIRNKQSVAGGCINQAFQISDEHTSYFVKLNHASGTEMFEAEKAGLEEMYASNSVRVPRPLFCGLEGSQCYLVMEYIDMGGGSSARLLGEQLAAMHRKTADSFGWVMDNTIGSTPQPNQQTSSWTEFWQQQRLGFQLDLARKKGAGSALLDAGYRLNENLGEFFRDYQPQPSLLHGDLWGGNYSTDRQGQPVIYDPAVYYGDREADIAMTELFGGFGGEFYNAYNDAWPLDKGYATRKTLYNLYHIVNHFNLFGGGYVSQATSMAGQLLAQLR